MPEAGSEAVPAGGGGGELAARRAKLSRWRARGVDPFGSRFPRTHLAREVVEGFPRLEGQVVRVAGRITALRRQGRVAFADLLDRSGRLQLFLREDRLGREPYAWLEDLDLGDWVGAEGIVCRTRAGEVSVQPERVVLLAKALRPLPAKWHGLRDPELRYRRRYLDLIANPASREVVVRRSRMI